jgi:hypothetical protein
LTTAGIREADLLKRDDASETKLRRYLPVVVVQANQKASINTTLERGAAVAGTVLYDDGSPAAGVPVGVLKSTSGKWSHVETSSATGLAQTTETDDRGHYRISGLPAEDACIVEVQMTVANFRNYLSGKSGMFTETSHYTMFVYSGDALRSGSAKPFALKSGEERGGEDIMLPISKLHRVQGVVTAQHDGHIINHAMLDLLFPDNKELADKTEIVEGESSFSFPFVAEGDYILRVRGPPT